MSESLIRWGVPGNTKALQLQASNPVSSAWVSAHAGSGKTFVLSQRVVRLLLEGVPPSKILCLTFTKAAAANMSLRVFDILSQWTRMDDAQLRAAVSRSRCARNFKSHFFGDAVCLQSLSAR